MDKEPPFALEKEEWWAVIRWGAPSVTRAEFEKLWIDFQAWLAKKEVLH